MPIYQDKSCRNNNVQWTNAESHAGSQESVAERGALLTISKPNGVHLKGHDQKAANSARRQSVRLESTGTYSHIKRKENLKEQR